MREAGGGGAEASGHSSRSEGGHRGGGGGHCDDGVICEFDHWGGLRLVTTAVCRSGGRGVTGDSVMGQVSRDTVAGWGCRGALVYELNRS